MYYIFTHQERESSQNQLLGISMPDFLIDSRGFKSLSGYVSCFALSLAIKEPTQKD